ncbi:MAG: hypothetical protein ACI4MS_07710, partial [Candidatus Coproplasma sp.]
NYYVLQDEDDDGYKLIAAQKGDFAFHNIENEDIFQEKVLFRIIHHFPKQDFFLKTRIFFRKKSCFGK